MGECCLLSPPHIGSLRRKGGVQLLIVSERWFPKYRDDSNAEYKYQISLTTTNFMIS